MKNKLRNSEYLLALFVSAALYTTGVSVYMALNNAIYGIEQIHEYDPAIFSGNLIIPSGALSPRTFMNHLVSLLMKLNGGSWAGAAVLLVYLGVAVLSFATVETVFGFAEKHRVALSAVLSYFFLKSVNNGFCGWGSYEINSIGMGTALAFSMLAISQTVGKNKRWNLAWCFLAVSSLFHVHEGIWGFCALALIYLSAVTSKKELFAFTKHWGLAVFAASLGFCVLPGLFGAPSELPAEQFVEIYAVMRAPHHLLPSSWGTAGISKYFLLIVCSAAVRLTSIKLSGKGNEKSFAVHAGLSAAAWLCALLAAWVFTEVIPNPTVVTMYVPKFFKYIGIFTQIWCVQAVSALLDAGKPVPAIAVMLTVWAAFPLSLPAMLAVYAVGMASVWLYETKKGSAAGYAVYIVLPAMVALRGLLVISKRETLRQFLVLAVFAAVILICVKYPAPARLSRNSAVAALLSVIMLLSASFGRVWSLDPPFLFFVPAESYVSNPVGSELYGLAESFRASAAPDESFIAESQTSVNSDEYSAWFQLVSERNCYVNYKSLPADQSMIGQWYERVLETDGLFDRTPEEIYGIMNSNGIKYILVPASGYGELDGSGLFEISNSSPNDSYRIYVTR